MVLFCAEMNWESWRWERVHVQVGCTFDRKWNKSWFVMKNKKQVVRVYDWRKWCLVHLQANLYTRKFNHFFLLWIIVPDSSHGLLVLSVRHNDVLCWNLPPTTHHAWTNDVQGVFCVSRVRLSLELKPMKLTKIQIFNQPKERPCLL